MRTFLAFVTGATLATSITLHAMTPPPLTDRQAVVSVEEDGSYSAGCIPGALCDDGGAS